jgi:hypothetical protein
MEVKFLLRFLPLVLEEMDEYQLYFNQQLKPESSNNLQLWACHF